MSVIVMEENHTIAKKSGAFLVMAFSKVFSVAQYLLVLNGRSNRRMSTKNTVQQSRQQIASFKLHRLG
jgi:hypothetical protein